MSRERVAVGEYSSGIHGLMYFCMLLNVINKYKYILIDQLAIYKRNKGSWTQDHQEQIQLVARGGAWTRDL